MLDIHPVHMRPDEDRVLYEEDALIFLQIPSTRWAFFDLILGQQLVGPEPSRFGEVDALLERKCSRCTMCNRCCERMESHLLCSHGDLCHLWCSPTKRRPQDPLGCYIAVEGYCNGTGLLTRFTEAELRGELPKIVSSVSSDPESFRASLPFGFNLS